MRFMWISTPLRPIIAETNQFLRFLRLIHLALNEIKSLNSECTPWVFIPRPTRLRYAARGHNFQLHVIIIIGIQPLGRSGQRPELSQATGMALVRCILGKFLGVACHCFPPLSFF